MAFKWFDIKLLVELMDSLRFHPVWCISKVLVTLSVLPTKQP